MDELVTANKIEEILYDIRGKQFMLDSEMSVVKFSK